MKIAERPSAQKRGSWSSGATRSLEYGPFALVLIAFSLVTLWLAAQLNLYIDELYSLHTTSRGFGYALEQSLGFEQQPPLFFLALTAWRAIDASDYFARLFSIGCCLVTLLVVWRFGRRYFSTLPNWLPPLAVAINPFFMWVALDIRVYAMSVTISALLISLFFDAFTNGRIVAAKVAAFTVVAIAGLYTQYFIGFMFVGFGVALLLGSHRKRLVLFASTMVVVAVSLLPLLLHSIGREFREETAGYEAAPLRLAVRMLGSTLSFAYPHTWIAVISRSFNVPYFVIVVVTLALILRERRTSTILPALLSIVASIVASFLAIIIVIRTPLEMPRHISSLFVPTVLLVLALLAAIEREKSRTRISLAYVGFLLIFSIANDSLTYRLPLSNSGDWQRVAAVLNANVKPSEPIAVFDTEGALGVRHYYRGSSPIYPLPHPQNFTVFDRRDFSLKSARNLAIVFPAPSAVTGRVWLVYGVTACALVEIDDSCELLNSFVTARFNVVMERKFNGTNVEELQSKRVRSEPTSHLGERIDRIGFSSSGARAPLLSRRYDTRKTANKRWPRLADGMVDSLVGGRDRIPSIDSSALEA